jgi:hypothetical protein
VLLVQGVPIPFSSDAALLVPVTKSKAGITAVFGYFDLKQPFLSTLVSSTTEQVQL